MRRRSKSEIQVAYARDIYNPDDTANYDLLIPKYPSINHNDKYDSVAANNAIDDGDNYDRDNYHIIPYKVPPMMFNGVSYALSWGILSSNGPSVSISRGTNYDKYIWADDSKAPRNLWMPGFDSFSAVVLAAYPLFTDILNASLYICTNDGDNSVCFRNTGYPDYINQPSKYQCGPLDKIDSGYLGISEAFGYAWSESWDMGLVTRPVKFGNTTITDESSSSSSGIVGGCDVYLCKIVNPPSGNGGSASVTVITVDGYGNIKPGKSMVVNVPAI